MKFRTYWMGGLAALHIMALPNVAGAQDANELTLDDALRQSGLRTDADVETVNPRLVGPREDVNAAEALIDQARLRPNPEVSLEVENIAGTGAFSGLRSSEYTLAVAVPLELGGKRGARISAAEAQLGVERIRGELAEADLGYLVRQRYLAAVAARARFELYSGIVERNRELTRISAALVKAGREPPLRAMRARSQLAEAEADLRAAEANLLGARFALGAMWNSDVPPSVPLTFPEIRSPYESLREYTGLRSELASAERRAAVADIARQESLGIPDPTISAGVKRFEESDESAFVVGVSIPLPFWNRNQGNIAAAQARERAAAAAATVAESDYRIALAEARARLAAAEIQARTLEAQSLPEAEEALRLVEIGYRNGRFPLIEVLAAADARDAIRLDLIEARKNEALAAAELIWLAAE